MAGQEGTLPALHAGERQERNTRFLLIILPDTLIVWKGDTGDARWTLYTCIVDTLSA